jgi:soluble lytic murein transglycosylase-like protein
MQIMPATARGLGVDAFDPAQAVDGAARILAANLKEFGSVDLALAAYNAGGGAVKKYGGIPPFAETQAYVPKVKAALAALGGNS